MGAVSEPLEPSERFCIVPGRSCKEGSGECPILFSEYSITMQSYNRESICFMMVCLPWGWGEGDQNRKGLVGVPNVLQQGTGGVCELVILFGHVPGPFDVGSWFLFGFVVVRWLGVFLESPQEYYIVVG